MGYIYKIYNDVNDHLYIGQTSQPISDRWEGHKSSARNSTLPSFNDTVHIAMRKYGIEKFHIVEIEKCDNELLNEREEYWIDYYDSFNNGYNETRGGAGCRKYDHKEIIEAYKQTHNLSETARQIGCNIATVVKVLSVAEDSGEDIGRYLDYEWAKEPIYQIDKDTLEIVAEYPSIQEAARAMNGTTGHLSSVINKRLNDRTAYGYLWQKVKDYDGSIQHIDNRTKQVLCVETNQVFKTRKSAVEWLKENNSTLTGESSGMSSNISRAIKRNIKAYGFHWKEI